MELNSKVCAGIKGNQEQNSAIPHCVDAHAKVLARNRGAQTAGPGALTPFISCRERDKRSLAESLAAVYAQWKAQKRAENDPLS